MAQVHIYGAQFSTFVRVVQLVCEEKSIDYTLGLTIDNQPAAFKSPAHLAIHPFGKMPMLQHQGRWLTESAAIIRYLDTAFDGPKLTPDEPLSAALMDEWVTYLATYINHAYIRDYLLELAFPKGPDNTPRLDVMQQNKPAALAALDILNQQLADKPFLMGDSFTLADAMAAPSLYYARTLPEQFALLTTDSPLAEYSQRIEQRASGQKVLLPKA